ncbi:hypothetical protein MMC34_008674 [Xylographa carneopallida]|nr:hypothetical protein [Xylographa carneopallida]
MSEAGEDELVMPVPASSHRFKRFGTVQFSDPAYTQSPLLSSPSTVSSLLAVSNRYGRLFILSSSSPPALFVASTSAVLESVEADKREQATEAQQEDGREGSKRTSDAAASPSVFARVAIANSERVRHLCLSPDEQWLLLLSDDGAAVYHISQFAQPAAGAAIQPTHSIELSDVIDVQWCPHQPSLLLALDRAGQLSTHAVTAQGVVERSRHSSDHSTVTAVCASTATANRLYLGHADGSLHFATLTPTSPQGMVVTKRLPAHNPSTGDFSARQPALHFIGEPSASTLLLGYALSQSGDAESRDYLTDADIERIAVCSLSLPTMTYTYLGDVLQDELRMTDPSAPYSARHRYSALTLPALSAAVLYSNRAGETALLGPEPADDAEVASFGTASSGDRRWVAYEMAADTDRAVVPLDGEWKDTYALGMALDVTNTLSVAVRDNSRCVSVAAPTSGSTGFALPQPLRCHHSTLSQCVAQFEQDLLRHQPYPCVLKAYQHGACSCDLSFEEWRWDVIQAEAQGRLAEVTLRDEDRRAKMAGIFNEIFQLPAVAASPNAPQAFAFSTSVAAPTLSSSFSTAAAAPTLSSPPLAAGSSFPSASASASAFSFPSNLFSSTSYERVILKARSRTVTPSTASASDAASAATPSTAIAYIEGAEQRQSELDAPMPLLLMLTSDARLHMYHLVCTQPSMAEASRRVMKTAVEDIPEEETYEEQLAAPQPPASAPATPSPPVATPAVTSTQPAVKPTFALPTPKTKAAPFAFGPPTTTSAPFSFASPISASGSTAAPARPVASSRPAHPVASTVPAFSFAMPPKAAASSVPAAIVGSTPAAAASSTSPHRSQKRSAASLPEPAAQSVAQLGRQQRAPAPPTIAEALSMLAAALPHASQAEANVAVTALRSLLSPADSGPSTFPSTTSASRTSSAAPAPLLGKPAASALRPSRAAAPFSDNSKSDQPPPAMPASLSRPVQYVSSLNVDDFRLAGSCRMK